MSTDRNADASAPKVGALARFSVGEERSGYRTVGRVAMSEEMVVPAFRFGESFRYKEDSQRNQMS